MDLLTELESLIPELEKGLDQASSLQEMEALRVEFLGRKGRIARIMSRLPELEPAQRPLLGQTANRVKESLTAQFEAKKTALDNAEEAAALARFDAGLPGRRPPPCGAGGDLFWGGSAFARAPGPFRPPAAGSGPAKQRGARLSAFRRRRLARPCAGQSAPRARARRRYSPESSPAGRLYRPRLNSVFGSPCTSVFCCSRQVNEARNPISRNSASASGQVLP